MRARAAVVAVAVAALCAVLAACDGDGGTGAPPDPFTDRAGSEALPGGPAVLITHRPGSYRVVYRLEERLGDDVRVSREERWIRRPFDSRLEVFEDGDGAQGLVERRVATLGRRSEERPGVTPFATGAPPAVPGDELRADIMLATAVGNGNGELRERRQILDRICQVYRTAVPLTDPLLHPATADRYVDTCIDSDGLMLEEIGVRDSRTHLRRVATEVEVDPTLADELFAVGDADLDVRQGGASVVQLEPTSTPPGTFWQLDAEHVPGGFTLQGRYQVVPPQPENFATPERAGYRRAEITDVYVSGIDVITVTRGGTLHGGSPFDLYDTTERVELGALGPGEVVVTGRGFEVRARPGVGGHYVIVAGTRAVDELVAIARALHEVPGGELRYLEPPPDSSGSAPGDDDGA